MFSSLQKVISIAVVINILLFIALILISQDLSNLESQTKIMQNEKVILQNVLTDLELNIVEVNQKLDTEPNIPLSDSKASILNLLSFKNVVFCVNILIFVYSTFF